MEIIQQTIDGEMVMVNFNYGSLTQENQIFLRNTESVIMRSVNNIGVEYMTIGRSLLEAKERLPHGHFSQWVEGNLPFGDRMAQQMMNVARDPNANRYAALGFNLSVQKQLAAPSTPNEVKEAIMTQAESGAVITAEAVKAAKLSKFQHHCTVCNRLWRELDQPGDYQFSAKGTYTGFEEKICHFCDKQPIMAKGRTNNILKHCHDCDKVWQENKKGYSILGDRSKRNLRDIYCEEKICPVCTNNPKRYCPNCSYEQRTRAGAGYFTTCIHCQTSHKFEDWLTEPRHVRYCRHCNEKRLIPPESFERAHFVKCRNKKCGREELAGDWLTAEAPDWLLGDEPLPPPVIEQVAPEPKIVYCPNCGKEGQVIANGAEYNMLGCGKCGNIFDKSAFLTEPPPQKTTVTKQLTTPRLCPECYKPQEVLELWLQNEKVLEQGMLKCEQCGKATPLKTWQQSPTAEVATVAESSEWAEDDLRHWRGELKKMFGGMVNEFCKSNEAWSTFDQVLLKIRHHLTTQEPSHLAQIDELLTPKGAQFINRQETDHEIYRLRGAVSDNILDLSIHKLNQLLGYVKQLQEN